MVYTNNVPQGNQTIANSQPQIQANFGFLDTGIGTEHNFNAAGSGTDMYHLQASMPNRTLDPVALPADTNGMYYVRAGGARFYDGTTICKLTEGNAATNGYQWIGKVLVQWGFKAVTTQSTGSTTFITANINFPTACFNVIASPVYDSGSSTPTNSTTIVYIDEGTTTNTGFGWRFVTNSSSVTGFFWVAIGN